MSTIRSMFIRLWVSEPEEAEGGVTEADQTVLEESNETPHKVAVKSTGDTDNPVWWEQKPVRATGDERFWVHDGSVVADLTELADVLHDMREDQFAHHASGETHDFAVWVEEVLENSECASALRDALSSDEAERIINRYLS